MSSTLGKTLSSGTAQPATPSYARGVSAPRKIVPPHELAERAIRSAEVRVNGGPEVPGGNGAPTVGGSSGVDNALKKRLYSSSTLFSKAAIANTVKPKQDSPEDSTTLATSVKAKSNQVPLHVPVDPKVHEQQISEWVRRQNSPPRPALKGQPVSIGSAPIASPIPPPNSPSRPTTAAIGQSVSLSRPTTTSVTIRNSPSSPQSARGMTTSKAMNKSASAFGVTFTADDSLPQVLIDKLLSEKEHDAAPLQFVYLNIREQDATATANPYDVYIVPHSQSNTANYLTFSSRGVTHFHDGDSEFTPLKQWLRERNIFNSMVSIPFVYRFRVWKTFFFWKKYIRRTTINKYKGFLEDNLFFLNKGLRGQLMQVRRYCLDIQDSCFYRVSSETQTLEQYVQSQTKQKEITARDLNKIISKVATVVSEACRASQAAHASMDNALAELKNEETTPIFDEESSMSMSVRRRRNEQSRKNPHSLLSVVSSDEPYRQSYTELSQKRAECRRLTCYIRLVDFMVIDSLVNLNMSSVAEVLKVMKYPRVKAPSKAEETKPAAKGGKVITAPAKASEQKDKKKSIDVRAKPPISGIIGMLWKELDEKGDVEENLLELPIFSTELLFNDGELIIVPNQDSFDFKVESVLKGFTEEITKVPRLLQMEDFKAITAPVIVDHAEDGEFGAGPQVGLMVTGEDTYKVLVQSIRESIGAAFRDVEDYAAHYITFQKMYLENRRMEIRKIKKESPPLDWFKSEMDKYKAQYDDCGLMRKHKKVGLFFVKTDKLRLFFLPSPMHCLNEIQNLLPVLAKEKNQELLDEVASAVQTLALTPTTVEEFVQYFEFHTRISARMDDLENMFENVKELYNLMEFEKVESATH